MKDRLKHYPALLLLIFISCESKTEEPLEEEKTVYVCESATSYSYHFNPECRGLKKCSRKIAETTISSAKKQGRRFCGWEAKNTIVNEKP